MKRLLIAVLLLSAAFLAPNSQAQKVQIDCPETLNDIRDCPDTGCSEVKIDARLNQVKNVRRFEATGDDRTLVELCRAGLCRIENKDFDYLKSLPDPVAGYKIGDTREKLRAWGEGKMIRIVAWALKARSGVKESCNCGLTRAADTDNHIVLADPKLKRPTLTVASEKRSLTAEFTPRVRLDHPELKGSKLQSLIVKNGGRLLVRMIGQQMFDGEHSKGAGGRPLHNGRANNWEIHPVFALEYCPRSKTCTAGSNANWINIEN